MRALVRVRAPVAACTAAPTRPWHRAHPPRPTPPTLSLPPALPQQQVFDIDETTLSNADEWLAGARGGGSGQPHVVGRRAVPAKVKGSGGGRPALEAVRAVYRHLWSHNYSVAFITGRAEPSRNTTEANLLAAGGRAGRQGRAGEASRHAGAPVVCRAPWPAWPMSRAEACLRVAPCVPPGR